MYQRRRNNNNNTNEEVIQDGIVEKLKETQEILVNVLQPKLSIAIKQRDQLNTEIDQYVILRERVELMIKNKTSQDENSTLVDIGSKCYVNAKIDDNSKIMIHIGMGFYYEYTLEEALVFIDEKEDFLTPRYEKQEKKAKEISDDIEKTLSIVEELSRIIHSNAKK